MSPCTFPVRVSNIQLQMKLAASLVVAGLLAGGCGTNSGPNGGGGSTPLGSAEVKVSSLTLDPLGDIRVDNTVVAAGTGKNGGIEYLLPASGTQTSKVAANQSLQVRGFAVANGWIACRNFNGDVFFHNTADGTTTAVPTADLALLNGVASTDEFWADDNFIVTYTDNTRVTDKHKIKFINFGVTPPTITSFTQDLPAQVRSERVLLAIDADNKKVVALQDDIFYQYDMNNPTATPKLFDISALGGVNNGIQFRYDNGFAIFHARQLTATGLRETKTLDFATSLVVDLPQNPSEPLDLLLSNGVFAYFVHQSENDFTTNSTFRSAWGTINTSGAATYTELHETDVLIGNTRADGLIGYGRTSAITKDGRFRFLAGGGNPAIAEILQVASTGDFKAVPTIQQFRTESPHGLPATNVVASNKICAFRVGGNDALGYVLIPQ